MKQLQRRRRTAVRPPRTSQAPAAAAPELAEANRARVAQALGSPVQARLRLGAVDDAQERAADRFADGVVQRQCSHCAQEDSDDTLRRAAGPAAPAGGGAVPAATAAAIQSQRGSGQPLPPAERGFFESRLPVPLSPVRLHTDPASAQLAGALGARAFTVGSDVFFGAGEYRPATPEGRHLLAHELAHVHQQAGGGAALQRQLGDGPATTAPATAAPTTATPAPETLPAVDRATFERRVADGLALLGGRRVGAHTMSAELQPLLRDLAAQAAWRDEHGRQRGGGAVTRDVGGVRVTLHMVYDDAPAPDRDAMFESRGADDGTFRVYVRRGTDAEDVATSLYHEALHMVSWLTNRARPAAFGSTAAPEVLRTLDLSRHTAGITALQRWLQRLADGVNQRRPESDTVTPAQIERTARWLVEEIAVRAETEVFGQHRAREIGGLSSGVGREIDGAPMEVSADIVRHYVFDMSGAFRPADGGAALTSLDREALAMLVRLLGGLYRTMLRRRFSEVAFTDIRPERPTVDIGPRPLEPPRFTIPEP